MPANFHSNEHERSENNDEPSGDSRNRYAIYQLKPDPQYHALRFASMSELQRLADKELSDVRHIAQASDGLLFPNKAAVEEYLQSNGLSTVPCAEPTSIIVENQVFQPVTIHLACENSGCWIESCDSLLPAQTVTEDRYHLVYIGDLSGDCVSTKEPAAILEDLFFRFNSSLPEDFQGHSMSVGDVVALRIDGEVSFYYTNTFDFVKLPSFLAQKNALRNAEMLMEDDYNMIDGILNNDLKPAANEVSSSDSPKKTDNERKPKHRKHRDSPER